MVISRVMTKNPISIHPEASVTEARALMDREKISYLPILDKSNFIIGIVTREDLLKASPSDATTLDMYEISYLLTKMKISEIMIKKVITVEENEVIEEAARIMADKNIGCLPVMKGPYLSGIITETDLFNVFIDAFGARRAGVRIIIIMGENPGELAKVCKAIGDKGGNIISVIISDGDDSAHRRGTIKVENLSGDEVKTIIGGIPSLTLEDLRE